MPARQVALADVLQVVDGPLRARRQAGDEESQLVFGLDVWLLARERLRGGFGRGTRGQLDSSPPRLVVFLAHGEIGRRADLLEPLLSAPPPLASSCRCCAS